MLTKLKNGQKLSSREQLMLVCLLSFPAILAQISTIIMQYIDASMVGRLGADASAAVGLVISTTWLTSGLCQAVCVGFTVQIAFRVGAGKEMEARQTVKYGMITGLVFSFCMMGIVTAIHRVLPVWLGGTQEICIPASQYFLIYGLTLPILEINYMAGGMLQCSGDMKTPGMLNIMMCFLDVIFNYLLIFPCRMISVGDRAFFMPGAGLGIRGAALGTALAALCSAVCMLLQLLFRSEILKLRKREYYRLRLSDVTADLKVSLPVMASSLVMGSAYVAGTYIIAPLGAVAIAANSFAVTAESICYMPGYGIASAATTLVGQSKGAGRKELMKAFGQMTVLLGMLSMGIMAVALYCFAPAMMRMLTTDPDVRAAGVSVLRIVVFAEPFFGASIVSEGVFRGLGKTRIPTLLNALSMWCLRLPLAAYMAGKMGLTGAWTAMTIELVFRGMIYLIVQLNTKDL